jgi:hypothetical protein
MILSKAAERVNPCFVSQKKVVGYCSFGSKSRKWLILDAVKALLAFPGSGNVGIWRWMAFIPAIADAAKDHCRHFQPVRVRRPGFAVVASSPWSQSFHPFVLFVASPTMAR